ncbi:nuclear RNA export factor 2-like [Asbolus verrucosus]|uniref:Nuclear RNA export factor 2-like n=1 Tax=Asbolus verrucosus TaxID=1661398 RepID=A0A482VPU1_ASBVE|nr:nuclear RNA export factor 2-like [Asbolus verrucosus]
MDFKTVIQSSDAISINKLTFATVSRETLDNPTYWHKFLIVNVYGLKRDKVLKILFEHVKPLDLIPLHYTEEGKGAFFFARICGPVIEKLCNEKLSVRNPFDKNKPFKLKIVLKYTTVSKVKVDLSRNVMKVLQKRFNKSETLCLNNFSEDPDLTEYFLLSQPKLLAFVLNVARNLKPKALKLCHNEIKTLDALRIMPAESVVSVDLRHNLIRDLAELKHFENFRIVELWLEGNPLCELYDEYSYVQHVIQHCPKIEKLDGFLLRQNGVPSFRRNFLCNISAYDVIDQFLEGYFTTYDSKNLTKLESLYHKEALFSMTAEFFNKPTSQLKTYNSYARNLLHLPSGSSTNLCMGRNEILTLFNRLPQLEHDPYSFTVDAKCAIIVVTGVFREVPAVEKLLGFNRYFVLECCEDTYLITNEQLHVFSALVSQQVTAFKRSNVLQEAQNPTQQNQMINTFVIITNLTKEWAKMFLEECHYNLKHAVLLFVDLYKSDKIPSQGFKNPK